MTRMTTAQLSEAEHGVVVVKDVMIPMRDGVRLATDLYFPSVNGEPLPGPIPTVLGRTSYGKASEFLWVEPVAHFFAPRGYAVALQDLRGRGKSEGTGEYFHTANPKEGMDGYDTIEWIAAQPWSNGKVGTTGTSHGAIVQQCQALYRPPHLAAIWPDCGPTNSYQAEAREGGAFQMVCFPWILNHAQDSQEVREDYEMWTGIIRALQSLREWVWQTPFKRGYLPFSSLGTLEDTFFNYYLRGDYDEWWQRDCCDQQRYFDRHADVAGVYSGGWFDQFAAQTTHYYATMAGRNTTPQRLVMGPWAHGTMHEDVTFVRDVDFGPSSAWGPQRYNAERLRWFDRFLRDIDNGVERAPLVEIFVMGGGDGGKTKNGKMSHGGRWRFENEWPLARTAYTNFYLHNDGALRQELPTENTSARTFTYDPAHPVPTIGTNVASWNERLQGDQGIEPQFQRFIPPRIMMRPMLEAGGAHEQETPDIVGARPPYLPLASRADVLVFQTDILKEDVELTGPIPVHLWISSSAVDTDFTAKLLDVYPPNEDYPEGYQMYLADSIIRVRYRETWEKPVFMTPGEVHPVTISLPPTSNLFKAGHRIRIDISSSNFPKYDLNPNTGEPMGRHTHSVVAINSVHMDASHPSHATLPIIPASVADRSVLG